MPLPAWLATTLFVAACLLVPITWGWLTNWLFVRYGRRQRPPGARRRKRDTDATFSDYQI